VRILLPAALAQNLSVEPQTLVFSQLVGTMLLVAVHHPRKLIAQQPPHASQLAVLSMHAALVLTKFVKTLTVVLLRLHLMQRSVVAH